MGGCVECMYVYLYVCLNGMQCKCMIIFIYEASTCKSGKSAILWWYTYFGAKFKC